MAAVTPKSDLYLVQCPLEIDNKNQINFPNFATQYNYFSSLPRVGATNFSYQRKDSTIRFPANIDDINYYNYCMYRNDDYSDKWYYAFIESMEYLNDNTTLVKIKTDVWQTWQFNLNFKRSFVEREHVNDDTIGKHTLDEGLPTGEPMINDTIDYSVGSVDGDSQRFVAQVTQLPDGVEVPDSYKNRVYNGIPQGCYFIVMDQASALTKFTRWYDKKGQQNAIVAMFIAPKMLVNSAVYSNFNIGEGVGSTRLGFMPSTFGTYNFPAVGPTYSSTLNGYTPKNRKMYCYPYSYLRVSNNCGSEVVYKWEDWQDPTHTDFYVRGVLSQGCSIRLIPHLYKGNDPALQAYDYGLNLGKFPILSWSSDYYLNWQAQNGKNNELHMQMGIVSGVGQMIGGVAGILDNNAGQGISSLTGGAMNIEDSIVDAIHERNIAQLTPDQARGNTNSGDLSYSIQKTCFTFSKMSCRREYAVMIDNFFSMFGYKVNEVKIPNITGRSNWNYVRTKGCNILANDIPQEDLDEIKAMFDSGVTIWHKTAYFLDYSQNNPIV